MSDSLIVFGGKCCCTQTASCLMGPLACHYDSSRHSFTKQIGFSTFIFLCVWDSYYHSMAPSHFTPHFFSFFKKKSLYLSLYPFLLISREILNLIFPLKTLFSICSCPTLYAICTVCIPMVCPGTSKPQDGIWEPLGPK